MFSHKWEDGEPLLQKVEHTTIYELEVSRANAKLKTFCSLCCKNLWSRCLRGTATRPSHSSTFEVSRRSHGNQVVSGRAYGTPRAWTYQEYVAAETVQFYTEDWKPYLGLTLSNHKESPVILTEMEQVSHVSAQELAVLRPGLDRVREKLYMASTRYTTLMEDIAYSLLGIFNAAIPVIYGEGNRAIGRLLEHILTGSGDVTILAWTGRAGSYNSCLPTDLSVYNPLIPPHVPQPIETTEMNRLVEALRTFLPDLTLATTLYDRLCDLSSPYLAASRLRLPGVVFRLTELAHDSDAPKSNLRVYRATTSTLGDVEIKTSNDLSKMKDLYLVHPWIRPLLDQEFAEGAAELDKTTQALRFVARLRQPFGALLFEAVSRVEYRRVAADTLILVRVREETSLTELVDNVHNAFMGH
ncbi:hypothetical protein JVU11DRAFT_10307 [Chiua virens]|nr:hypothetical protein JVU11DRAFT_10307 [Chiua virens]